MAGNLQFSHSQAGGSGGQWRKCSRLTNSSIYLQNGVSQTVRQSELGVSLTLDVFQVEYPSPYNYSIYTDYLKALQQCIPPASPSIWFIYYLISIDYDKAQSAVCSTITMKIVIIKLHSCSLMLRLKCKLGLRYKNHLNLLLTRTKTCIYDRTWIWSFKIHPNRIETLLKTNTHFLR